MSDLSQIPDDELLRLLGQTETQAKPLQNLRGGVSQEAAASAAEAETGNPVAIGLGRMGDTLGSGIKQAGLEAKKLVSPGDATVQPKLAALRSDEADNAAAYKRYQKRFPIETAVGESLPAAAVPGGPLTVAGVMAALEGLRYGGPQDRATNALIGGASAGAGTLVGKAAGGYVNPELSKTQRETLKAGGKMGIKPRLSQVTQSPSIERFEDWSARMPFGAGIMDTFNKGNARAMNKGAAESMGQTVDESGQIGPEVFAKAKTALSVPFDKITKLGQVPVGGRLVNPILLNPGVGVAADDVLRAQRKLGDRANAAVTKLAENAKRMAGLKGRIDGEAYQLWHSDLSDAAYTAFSGGDSAAGKAYQKMLAALDKSADTSLRQIGAADLADELAVVRPQYANFKMLSKGRVAEGGDVSAPRTAQALRTKNPDAFRTGSVPGPLGTIGQWAESFPSLRSGSQTEERRAIRDVAEDPLTLATFGLPAAIGAKMTTSPIVTKIPAVMGGTKAGKVAENIVDPLANVGIQSLFRRMLQPQTP